MSLEFRLLGDVAVLADGHPLELGGTRQRSVLALLVLQRDRPIATELLADRLWPDEQPLTAIKTIQVYVSRLRRALGHDADRLTSSATGYRLAVADDELDAARFERGLREAREAVAAESPDAALARLDDALALWSGPALGDLAGEQFARREADRLEELRLQAQEELIELRIAAGSSRETIGELRRLVADQPGRERLWRLLMLGLYADGRQGEALQAYQDARRYLADELGLDPGQELQDLERAILTQEAPRPKEASRVPTSVADDASPAADAFASVPGAVEPAARRTRRVVTVLRANAVRSREPDNQDPEIIEGRERLVLDTVRRAVERHGGTIDRADPEGVTAIFGLTIAREDDALRAVRAAFELTGDSPSEADQVGFRLGVATGEVLAGPSDEHGSTVTGAPPQAAIRLAAEAAQREVLLAPETERLVRAVTSTMKLTRAANGPPGSSTVRLIALNDGQLIGGVTRTPFVGRGAELEALIVAFEEVASANRPGLATVIGAPGIGKSRLVAEFFARISERALILRSRCLPYGDGITYWPIRELVVAASGIGPDESRDEALAKLGTIVAGLDRDVVVRDHVASIIGLTDDPVPGEEIPWAVRRFFEAISAERPLVILVDDLQWAEPALLDLIEHVLTLGRGPILLITVARPELEEAHPDVLARPSLLLVRLDALDDSEAESLLDHLAPELPPGPLRSRILATAEGNPLFVEQFVAYVSDTPDTDERSLTDRKAANLPIPPTIGALLAARLDRLPDGERRLLERAAVVGRVFWAGAIAEMLPEDARRDLPRRLARLVRRDLIRPDRSQFPDDEAFRFRHLLIRDAAYAALPKGERADLHERFAGWLERRSGANPGAFDLILGYHLEQAYRYRIELGDDRADAHRLAAQALAFIAPAGQAAEQRGDPHAAVSLLRRAVELSPSGRERIKLLVGLRRALWEAGEREASDIVDAETVAMLAEHPDEGLEHRRRLSRAFFALDISVTEAWDAYAYYEGIGDRLGMTQTLQMAVIAHAARGEFTAAIGLIDRANVLALDVERPEVAAAFAAKTVWVLPDSPVPVPEALGRCWRTLDLAGSNRASRAMILIAIGELEAKNGEDDGWRGHFKEAKAIIDDLGLVMPLGASRYPMSLGSAELTGGEPLRVVELLRSSCTTLDRLGDTNRLASLAPLTAQTLLASGQLDEVERYAFWGRDIAHPDDTDAHAQWRIAISGLRSQQGQHNEAVVLAREAVALVAETEDVVMRVRAHHTLARALRAAGDEPAAIVAAHEARSLAAAKQDRATLRKIDAFLMGDG